MSNIYLTGTALAIAILISIVMFVKKSVINIETKTYKRMLICNIIEAFTTTLIVIVAMTINSEMVFKILNRVDIITIITWTSLMFYYIYNITVDKTQTNIKRFVVTLNIIMYFLALVLDVSIINNNGVLDSTGPLTYLGLIGASVYILLMILVLVFTKNRKKDLDINKYIPLYILISLLVVIAALRVTIPQINFISILLSFIDLIMIFTIENPDVKMIEQLEVAKDQADKANRAKTDFLSSMSHEIRTPLNAIVGFSDCINHASTVEEAKENAKDIINASNTLLEIVNGILDISKIEAGKLEITNSPYNAKTTFEELAKLISPKMLEKGLDFSYYIAPDLPNTLYGDHANIKKIVTNLLSNAAKYTEKGFVRYEVNCINTDKVSKLIISVEDSGRGIKQENVDKLFTKFQRLDEDKNTTIEGTGLGLAITKQLTELMGGKIIVHTVYGEGSKFTVVLNQPIEKKEVKVAEEVTKTTLDLKGVKVLIVDDNTLNLKVATKLLERFNADGITCSESGFNCLDRINNGEKYDVILMDDMMPKMSGVETLKKLREKPDFKIPVVALTANAITGMKEKYLSEGFNEYLPKPIEKEDLIKVMNTILNNNTIEEKEEKLEETPNEEKVLEEVEENKPKQEIIPVEDNIEDILQNTQKLIPIKDIETLEVIESEPEKEIKTPQVLDNNQEQNKYEEKEKFLRKKGIDLDKALELLGDMEMYNMTLKDFSDNTDTKWLKIRSYKNTKDLANYAIEVHSLKSDSKYLGFTKLAEIAYEHELKSKDNDEEFINNHFVDLENEYNKVMSIIDEYNSLNEDKFTINDLPH